MTTNRQQLIVCCLNAGNITLNPLKMKWNFSIFQTIEISYHTTIYEQHAELQDVL